MPLIPRLARRLRAAALLLCLPCLLCLTSPARAATALDRTELMRELGYDTLLAIDARQTSLAVAQGYREINPLLGPRPSPGQVNRHMLLSMAAHGLLTWLLPRRLRAPWQLTGIAVEAVVIGHNVALGVRWRF